MALTISLTLAIASNRLTYTITDATVYGTGGNPARSAVGVFCKAYKMSYDNVATALTTTGDDGDPETDDVWTVTASSQDGWNKVYFVIIPDFDSTATYAKYAAVFQPSTNKVYRSLQAANTTDTLTDTTWWEEITDPATLANNKGLTNESANITSLVYQRVLDPNSQYTYSTNISDMARFITDDEIASLQDYNQFAMWLDAIAVCDSRSEVLEGEQLCRRIESKFL